MSHSAARAALNAYTADVGELQRWDSRDRQARDLIVDVLLMFEVPTARRILGNVESDPEAEQPGATPIHRDL